MSCFFRNDFTPFWITKSTEDAIQNTSRNTKSKNENNPAQRYTTGPKMRYTFVKNLTKQRARQLKKTMHTNLEHRRGNTFKIMLPPTRRAWYCKSANPRFLFGQRVRKIEPTDHRTNQKRPTKHPRTIQRSVAIIPWQSCEKRSQQIQFGGRRGSKIHQKTPQNVLKSNAHKYTRKNTENVIIFPNDLTQFGNTNH